MLTHRTLDLLHSLGLHGMAKGFKDLDAQPEARAASNTPNGWRCSWNTRKRCASKSGLKVELEPPSCVMPLASRMSTTAPSAGSTARSF
ncbi:hypothetical protein ACVWXO_000755 [Bradyrhizobium sp. LM2.7]